MVQNEPGRQPHSSPSFTIAPLPSTPPPSHIKPDGRTSDQQLLAYQNDFKALLDLIAALARHPNWLSDRERLVG